MCKGAIAAKRIPAGTVICDYHGELCDETKQSTEYKDRPDNFYIFCFQFECRPYYIDAVRKCPCSDEHVRENIKGRLLNNSKKCPNVMLKPARVNGLFTLLLLTKVDVKQYPPLVFDYNCHKDPMSAQVPQMEEYSNTAERLGDLHLLNINCCFLSKAHNSTACGNNSSTRL